MSDRSREFLKWGVETFGPVALDRYERLMRFAEEAIELVHAEGLPEIALERPTDRIYSRRAGDSRRELAQAYVTLELFAEATGQDVDALATEEFARVNGVPREVWLQRHDAKLKAGIAL